MAVSTESEEKTLNISTFASNKQNYQYSSLGLPSLLLLSERGITRSPLAKAILSEKIYQSEYFGSIHCFARGISDIYELCSFDKRMIHRAKLKGFRLSGHCLKSNLLEISSAKIIIPLDNKSQQYVKCHTYYINGKVMPINEFLNSTNHRYIPDPFNTECCKDISYLYDTIIEITENACDEIMSFLPSAFN